MASMIGLPDAVDFEDAIVAPLVVAGAAVVTGLGSIELAGYGFGDIAVDMFGGLSYAVIVAILGFVVAWITNDRSLDDFRSRGEDPDLEVMFAAAGPALLALTEYSQEAYDIISGEVWIAGTATVLVSASYYLIAHY